MARRLKGAGYYFADEEVGEEALGSRSARLAALEEDLAAGAVDAARALDVALALEGGPARGAARRASVPLDAAVAASLAAAPLPGPSRALLLQRVEEAREASAPDLRARFDALEKAVAAGESP